MVDTEEAASFQEAQAHECWSKAMLDEMTGIEANETWQLTEALASHHPIRLKHQEGCNWQDHKTQSKACGERICAATGSRL
jgi:hypothetical protein